MPRKNWKKVSSASLLRLDPFCSTNSVEVQGFVPTRSAFFDKMYVKPSENNNADADDKRIKQAISDRTQNLLLFIKGYAGCGKSVYIQHLLYEYVTKNSVKTYNLALDESKDDSDKQKQSVHCLDVGAGTSKDDIRWRYTEDLASMITHDIVADKDIYWQFCSLINENNDAVSFIDVQKCLKNQLVPCKSILDSLYSNSEVIMNAISVELRKFEFALLLAIDCLWRIAHHLVDKQKNKKTPANAYYFICFDNLDAVDNIVQCNTFIQELCKFRRNMNAFQTELAIRHPEYRLNTFVIIVACRSVTWGKLHLSEYIRDDEMGERGRHLCDFDISGFFEYVKIVEKRIDYYSRKAKNVQNATTILKELQLIKELNEMLYVRNRFKPLFNYNYRKCVEVITEIITDSRKSIEEAVSLASRFDYSLGDGIFSGSSSIFFRAVFDHLKKNHLFDSSIMGLVDVNKSTDTNAPLCDLTSQARVILQYLYNETQEGGKCRTHINQIFEYFQPIYPLSSVCTVLDHLFSRNTAWRRPINIVKQPFEKNYEEGTLEQQAELYLNDHHAPKERFIEFDICTSGKEYIEFMVPHFEFFSCRASSKSCEYPALFSNMSLVNVDSIGLSPTTQQPVELTKQCVFDTTCEAVIESVRVCCEKLSTFNKAVMTAKGLTSEEYLQEPIVKRTQRNNPQLHEERIIFCHIYYLESYREYLINFRFKDATEKERLSLNARMIAYIEKYLDLYDEFIYPSQRDQIAAQLRTKIKTIKESNFRDFRTKVQVH